MYLRDNLEVVLEDRATARKVEPAPFSLESLIAWLEKQDPAEEYNFIDWEVCVLGQYTTAHGGTIEFNRYCIGQHEIPSGTQPLPHTQNDIANPLPWTMGSALTRAQAALERLS